MEEAPVTALTPDCDPDLSTCGSPTGSPGGGVRSTVVLLALVTVAVLGVVCTALALALFFALIREVGPQRALVITFVNPAVAVLLGGLLLDEPFTLGLAVGLPLILLGCALATRRSPVRSERSELGDVDAAVP